MYACNARLHIANYVATTARHALLHRAERAPAKGKRVRSFTYCSHVR